MMPDYNRFSRNRELFPRVEEYNTNRLICGHLNRLKFPPNIEGYLKERALGSTMKKAMARAYRCFCRRQNIPKDHVKDQLKDMENNLFQKKRIIEKLENIQISMPKSIQKE